MVEEPKYPVREKPGPSEIWESFANARLQPLFVMWQTRQLQFLVFMAGEKIFPSKEIKVVKMVDASNSNCRQEKSSTCLLYCEQLVQAKIPNQNNFAKFTKN